MKNLESKIYDVLKEAGVPVKQAKKMAKKTAQKAEFFIWEKKQGEDKNGIPKKETELDRAVDKAVDAAIDAVSDSKLGKLLDENMAELFGPEMGKMISRVENKVDDMSENGADEDVPAVSRMEEKKKINSLYDTIYRKISLTPDEEEFVANIKNAAAEADVENMNAYDRAEIFCSLLKRNANPRRLVKVKDVLNLKYYSFAKERQYEPVGKLLKEFEKYCFLQMPISEQLKAYYGANKPFYEIAREQNLLNGNPYDERKKTDMDEAGKHFTGELSMTTYYVANRYHSKTKCYLIPDEMKNCKNVLADISSIYLRMVEYVSSEADIELRKGLKKYINDLKPARFVLLNAYFKFMEDYVLAEDINNLIDLADIVDAGSCPEDSQFCDMYTRYDQYGASMLRLARTLNLVSVEYCDAEPLKLIFDLG